MSEHTLPRYLSRACSHHVHPGCLGAGCGCTCHQVCARCGDPCQGGYDVSQVIGEPRLVCANCYVIEVGEASRPTCAECGAPDAYCEPELDAHYLCVNCHQTHQVTHFSPLAS